jgi:hypothetical protein
VLPVLLFAAGKAQSAGEVRLELRIDSSPVPDGGAADAGAGNAGGGGAPLRLGPAAVLAALRCAAAAAPAPALPWAWLLRQFAVDYGLPQ